MVPIKKNKVMRHIIHYTSYIIALVLCACNPVQPTSKTTFPQEFTTAWEERYGVCYDSVPYAVVALDLYTDGLSLDTVEKRMVGTGYNLYLSDIFVPGDTLAPGEYHSLNIQPSTLNITPYTFLPGKDYEGTPHGMYLLYIENSQLQGIQLLDSGQFVMRDTTNQLTDLQFALYYTDAAGDPVLYECAFQGELPWRNK